MKRVLVILVVLFMLTGCANLSNTPTKKVEELFNNYQTLDNEVINQLNDVVNKEPYNETQKALYKDIMKDQYKGLTYEIKDEEINANEATVTAQITVKDYAKILKESQIYYEEHKDEFRDNDGNYESKYIDYRLNKLKDAKDKVTYTLEIGLTKTDKKWNIDGLTSDELEKIEGIYNYKD